MECDHTIFLSKNVAKLVGILSFNLPALESCPGKTEQCTKSCYANKGRFRMFYIIDRYQKNLEAAKCDCFETRMLERINFAVSIVRIHASGDFFSKAYFEKWVTIALMKPWVTFYAYTRTYFLNLSELPDNLIVYYSIDKTTVRENPTAERFARIIDGNKKTVPHLTPYKEGVICNSDECASCGYCFMKAESVYFLQKYNRYIDVEHEDYLALEVIA